MRNIIALIFFFGVSPAMALPINSLFKQQSRFPMSAPGAYDYEGIVQLSNCSGSLIRFASSKDTDKAMVMTNGHCLELGFPRPGTYHYGKPSSRTFWLLDSAANSTVRVRATQIMYSTMTGTDLTLYRLSESFEEIRTKYGVRPLTLSYTRPSGDMMIEIISGYWKRGFTCGVGSFITELREEGYVWHDSIRYSSPGCETYGGTSGSPIIMNGSRLAIGINNTGNENGQMCTMNNPCEVLPNGQTVAYKGASYGQQAYWVYTCLNESNEIDLQRPGCLLYH